MSRSPYPGLRPFEPDETDIFFGRETHVDAMVNRLAQHHLLAVTGTSGCGKSSLVKAGLLEALEIGLLAEAGPVWRIAQVRTGNHPMSKLAESLVVALGGDRYENDIALRQAALERGPLALVEELQERPLPDGGNLLIIADQFEELFRYRGLGLAGREETEAFVALLLASARESAAPVYVVLTMRSDFLGECAQFEGLAEAVSDAQYLCPRLSRDQITAAIEGPAAVFGGKVEALLTSRIVNDMGTDPDQLPLMQLVLMRLWDAAKERDPAAPVLRLEDYLAVDGIRGCLSRHADEILAEAARDSPQSAEIAKRLFCLLTDGEGERAIRRLARVGEVMEVSGAALAEVTLVADAFRAPGRSLLMPPLDQPLDPETVLDISHESLIRQWRTLKDWARAEASSAEQYRATERQARRCADRAAELWDGIDLAIGLAWRERERPSAAWAARYGGDHTLAMRFLDESRHAERRRRLIGRTVAAAAFAIVSVFAGLAGWQWRVAWAEKQRAESTLELATATANTFVYQFALNFGNAGMPVTLTKHILDQARALQDTLFTFAQPASMSLLSSRGEALYQTAELLHLGLGDRKGALDAATQARDIFQSLLKSSPDDARWQYAVSEIDNTIGDVLDEQGHLDDALAAHTESVNMTKRVANTRFGSERLQVSLSNSERGIGDVLKEQGHLEEALAAYRDALAVREALPENNVQQQYLAQINERIGGVLKKRGNLNDALASYSRCLTIMKTLAQNSLDNTRILRNLKASYENVGEALVALGQLGNAVAAFGDGLAIAKRLVAMDTDNALWQKDLALSDREMASALKAQGILERAVAAYRESLDITQPRARDAGNPDWQRGTAEGDEGIGDAFEAQGNVEAAVAAYSDALAIRKALVQTNFNNTGWQDDLAASQLRLGRALLTQGDLDGASVAFHDALGIVKALALKDPSNLDWQRDLAEIYEGIGNLLKAQGHVHEALTAYRDSLAIRRTLSAKGPENALWQTDLAGTLQKAASAGDDAEANLAEAIAILRRLETAGTLWPEKRALTADVEAALAMAKPQ